MIDISKGYNSNLTLISLEPKSPNSQRFRPPQNL